MNPLLAVAAPDDLVLEQLTVECDNNEIAFERVDAQLPPNATGLLIYAPNDATFDESFDIDLSQTVQQAISASVPILASATGMHLLNATLDGSRPHETAAHAHAVTDERRRSSIFLAPGAKVSSTIGGSGWLSIQCDHRNGISQADLAMDLMPSAIADDRVVEAYEMPGHQWVIGVQWDIFSANPIPRGFDAIWMAFMERLAGD
ncbi:MAG: gamma-glutamyl-gamma-aminobutyrate hydrolase family protein [Chloroflexi bacterium]|nr:gamma-glutamyl-gamma-aminobutyrate hydrolase family protein [Chloroflexota bacterium]